MPAGRICFVDMTPEKLKDLQNLFKRGLNTWDGPPSWLLESSDRLDALIQQPPTSINPTEGTQS